MINGVSIDGGDDVAAFHNEKTLAAKIKSLGGKQSRSLKDLPKSPRFSENKASFALIVWKDLDFRSLFPV